MRWYVASSWKNAEDVREIVDRLRSFGAEAYDFTKHSFDWEEIEPLTDDVKKELDVLEIHQWYDHPLVKTHFRIDMAALQSCDALVALFPAGNSTHIEMGIVKGRGKPIYLISKGGIDELDRDLLYLCFDNIYGSITEFIRDKYYDKLSY